MRFQCSNRCGNDCIICLTNSFPGRYEWPPSAYKHVYFNCTANTLKIWFVIVFGVLAAYEAVRYVVSVIRSRKLRIQMFALFLSSVYPHYYGWWGFFSYLNEDYYPQWYHQLFFSITELLSTAIVVHLCSLDNRIQPWKLLIILDINLVHVIVGGLDQFIINVIHKQGQNFEVFRDIGLMIPDIFHVLVAYFELTSLAERKATTVLRMFYREELLGSLVLVVLFSVLGKNV